MVFQSEASDPRENAISPPGHLQHLAFVGRPNISPRSFSIERPARIGFGNFGISASTHGKIIPQALHLVCIQQSQTCVGTSDRPTTCTTCEQSMSCSQLINPTSILPVRRSCEYSLSNGWSLLSSNVLRIKNHFPLGRAERIREDHQMESTPRTGLHDQDRSSELTGTCHFEDQGTVSCRLHLQTLRTSQITPGSCHSGIPQLAFAPDSTPGSS
ncbi:hypothetical protein BKA58DRAFT_177175 [Alternaria rosae]|uniref:uncharacterized protein n=1 Tax=Alternaria rosae TaxID=1187941 RepID=UPI001E8DD36D|nr:uncharacterized protein BKA58DRAFT_177175 [Alternaria rosae]KAH6870465.1 hypothetical protein BKA58DRAFT_177175 [Alternaria rosae]